MMLRSLIWLPAVTGCFAFMACSHTVVVQQDEAPKVVAKVSSPSSSPPAPPARKAAAQGDPLAKNPSPPEPKTVVKVSAEEPAKILRKTTDLPLPVKALDPEPRVPATLTAAAKPAEGTPAPSRKEEESPLLLAFRAYLNNQPAEALAFLRRYDKATQEILICLLPLVVRASEGAPHSTSMREYSNMVSQLDRLSDRLRPRAELVIEKICFCTDFGSFGIFKPFPEDPPRFAVGERVNLYVELKNFTSQWRDGRYSIEHMSTITFLDFNGHVLSTLPIDMERPDQSRSIRHDFGFRYSFPLPPMSPGFKTLVLRITDVPTGRTTERTADFQVKHAVNK